MLGASANSLCLDVLVVGERLDATVGFDTLRYWCCCGALQSTAGERVKDARRSCWESLSYVSSRDMLYISRTILISLSITTTVNLEQCSMAAIRANGREDIVVSIVSRATTSERPQEKDSPLSHRNNKIDHPSSPKAKTSEQSKNAIAIPSSAIPQQAHLQARSVRRQVLSTMKRPDKQDCQATGRSPYPCSTETRFRSTHRSWLRIASRGKWRSRGGLGSCT